MEKRFFLLVVYAVALFASGCAATDPAKAILSYDEWCRDSYAAAVAGDPQAQLNVGDCFARGLGTVQQDFRFALAWYAASAHNGNDEASIAMIRRGAYLSCEELNRRTGVGEYKETQWGNNINNTFCF